MTSALSTKTFAVEITSTERTLFSGEAAMVFAQTHVGEVGLAPGHTQLLAALKPGDIRVQGPSGQEAIFYVSGGILEVQPERVTVLSDTAIRAEDLDEEAILAAKQRAEGLMTHQLSETEYAQALAELAQVAAQLQALSKLRKKIHS